MPDSTTLAEAEQKLHALGGFDWLLSGTQWWAAKDVSEHLKESGIGGHKETVTRWIKTLPGTQDFGGLGLRAKRDELIIFFATRITSASGESGEQVG